MSIQCEEIVENISQLCKSSNFNGAIAKVKQIHFSGNQENITILRTLMWPIPSSKDFEILSEFVISNNIQHIYSIGCGTGLLEFLLLNFISNAQKKQNEYSNSKNEAKFKITGIEIDSTWWNSRYAPPQFLPLKYSNEDFDPEEEFGNVNDAAMFCYFNNLGLFLGYLKSFKGTYIILIGPVRKQFCAPCPTDLRDNDQLPIHDWNLILLQRFGEEDVDYVGIYKRVLVEPR